MTALLCFDPGYSAGLASLVRSGDAFKAIRVGTIDAPSHQALYARLHQLVAYECAAFQVDGRAPIGVVEMPPERPPKGKKPQAGVIGFAAGIFAAICYSLGVPVIRVPVKVIRRTVFGRIDLNRAQAKAAAHKLAIREFGVTCYTDDEADALAIARWAWAIIDAPEGHSATQSKPAQLLRALV